MVLEASIVFYYVGVNTREEIQEVWGVGNAWFLNLGTA